MLANSDFLTSAFPAEYGNAISGVFDLNFRKGNKDNYEFTAGVGAYPGVEFVAEGPMGKIKVRFWSLVATELRVILVDLELVRQFRIITMFHFILILGKSKLGNFTLFGIAGFSNIEFLGKDATDEDLFSAKDANQKLNSDFYAFGLTPQNYDRENSFLKTTIGTSNTSNVYKEDRLFNIGTPTENKIRYTQAIMTKIELPLIHYSIQK